MTVVAPALIMGGKKEASNYKIVTKLLDLVLLINYLSLQSLMHDHPAFQTMDISEKLFG